MKLKITKFDHFGRGIGKYNDKVYFIDKALPSEEVNVIVTNNKKNFSQGKIDKIIKESKDRIKPICPFYNKCGGCSFLHASFDIEKDFKINKGRELLGKVDDFFETKGLNYRNKVTLHVKGNKIGFYEEKSNNIIEIDYCYLLNDNLNKVIKTLREIDLSSYKISEIVIKTNQDKLLMDIDSLVDEDFINHFNYVDSIISKNIIVKGKGFIEEIIDNKIFKITPKAFFQVNKSGLENINKIIQKFLNNKNINHALDLYSGTSLWGILISNKVKEVTSIEINKEASLDAKDNIIKNKINNIKVINGDVKDYIDKFKNIDLVIVDPPRSGLDKKTREYLKTINSKYIIYISCDMMSLKRDLNNLKEFYDINNIYLVDMFKRTYHCEVVTILERK